MEISQAYATVDWINFRCSICGKFMSVTKDDWVLYFEPVIMTRLGPEDPPYVHNNTRVAHIQCKNQ